MNVKHTLIASVLAGLGASLCCVGPLLLLSLGIGGTWMATLTAFEPVRPLFIALALLFIGLTFRKLYAIDRGCEPGKPCVDEAAVVHKQRFIFWIVSVLLLGLLTFPWFAPLFY